MAIDFGKIMAMNFGNNSMNDIINAFIIFIIALLVLRIFKFFILHRLRILAKKTKTKLDDLAVDILDKMGWGFYIILSSYIGLKKLILPSVADKWLDYIIIAVLTYYVIRGVQAFIDYGTKIIIKKQKDKDMSIIKFMSALAKALLWLIAVLLILSNLGYNVTSLMAGLGVGGIAVALALQNILSDLFASVSIYFDKPFKVGDFIIVGEHLGAVKKIGIKTTRIESLWGEEIVISNQELTSTRIRNFKKMEKRRIHFVIGVTYQTSAKKLKNIPKIVHEIFKTINKTELDRVHFKEFGDFSLKYEIAYYILSKEYNDYMDAQQEFNIKLVERFEKEGIEFAYPTQTLFLNK